MTEPDHKEHLQEVDRQGRTCCPYPYCPCGLHRERDDKTREFNFDEGIDEGDTERYS